MIFYRTLFYKLAEMALDGFFDSIAKNFRKLDLKDGIRLSISNIKVGDKFSKVTVMDDGNYTYYDVTITDIHNGGVTITYMYMVISTYSSMNDYCEGALSEDLRHRFRDYIDGSEEDELYRDFYSIRKSVFDKIFNELKPFMKLDIDGLFFDSNMVGWK